MLKFLLVTTSLTATTNFTQPVECQLCQGRICSEMKNGRLINDNYDLEIDTSKIKMSEIKIEDCEIRNSSFKENI